MVRIIFYHDLSSVSVDVFRSVDSAGEKGLSEVEGHIEPKLRVRSIQRLVSGHFPVSPQWFRSFPFLRIFISVRIYTKPKNKFPNFQCIHKCKHGSTFPTRGTSVRGGGCLCEKTLVRRLVLAYPFIGCLKGDCEVS